MSGGSTTTTQSIPQWQEDFIRGTVFPLAENVAGKEFTPYGGQMTPNANALTTGAGDIYSGIANMTADDYAARTAANMSPYTQNVIDTSLAQMQRNQAKALTGLEAQNIRAGAFGSRGDVAQGEFMAGNLAAQNELVAKLQQDAFTNAQTQTQNQLANTSSAAAGMSGIGNTLTALDAAKLEADFGEFMRQQGWDASKLAQILGAAQGGYGGSTTSFKKNGVLDYLAVAAGAAS